MMVTMGVVYRYVKMPKGKGMSEIGSNMPNLFLFFSLGRIRVCYSPWKIMHDGALLISLDHLMIYIYI